MPPSGLDLRLNKEKKNFYMIFLLTLFSLLCNCWIQNQATMVKP